MKLPYGNMHKNKDLKNKSRCLLYATVKNVDIIHPSTVFPIHVHALFIKKRINQPSAVILVLTSLKRVWNPHYGQFMSKLKRELHKKSKNFFSRQISHVVKIFLADATQFEAMTATEHVDNKQVYVTNLFSALIRSRIYEKFCKFAHLSADIRRM